MISSFDYSSSMTMTPTSTLLQGTRAQQRAALLQVLRTQAANELQRRAWRGDAPWFTRDDGKPYVPHRGQEAFHASTARFRGLFGGRGSGKTGAGAQEALRRIRMGQPGAVINPDFENFKLSTWPEMRRWLPWEHVVQRDHYRAMPEWEPSQAFTIHFDNGAVAYCKGLKDPDSARGPNINWLWYDEGSRDKNGMGWRVAVGGVRIGPNPQAWATFTPRGMGNWTNKLFVENDIPEDVAQALAEAGYEGEMYAHFFASIHDNRPNLDPLFYASMLATYTGKLRLQELEGQIVQFTEGLVYETFGPENITLEAEYDPETRLVEVAYDDGFTNPRAFLFIQRKDRTIDVFDELYHPRHQPATCVGEAKALVANHRRRAGDTREPLDQIEIAVGDPSAATLAAAWRQGDVVARGAKCGVVEGINVVRGLFRTAEGEIYLRVHPRCKRFISEMTEGYQYPEGKAGRDPDEQPVKADDHGPDAFRYWAWLRARRG